MAAGADATVDLGGADTDDLGLGSGYVDRGQDGQQLLGRSVGAQWNLGGKVIDDQEHRRVEAGQLGDVPQGELDSGGRVGGVEPDRPALGVKGDAQFAGKRVGGDEGVQQHWGAGQVACAGTGVRPVVLD